MDVKLRRTLALMWQNILKTDPKKLYGDQYDRLLNRNWGDRIPQPGYVGHSYAKGGIVFVGMNPGGGPKEGLGDRDKTLYKGLEGLRDADNRTRVKAFEEVNSLLESMIPTYKYARSYVMPVLQGAGLQMADVAYLNLLKWRTRGGVSLNKLYDISWCDHTSEQIGTLAPRMVVAVGVDAGKALSRHQMDAVCIETIPRVIGNNIDDRGKKAIRRIIEKI